MAAENNKPPAETKLTDKELAGIRNHPDLDKLIYTVAYEATEMRITHGNYEIDILTALVKAARKNLDAVRKYGVTIIVNAAFDATYDKTYDREDGLRSDRMLTIEQFKDNIDKDIPTIIEGYERDNIHKFTSVDYIRSEVDRVDARYYAKHAARKPAMNAASAAFYKAMAQYNARKSASAAGGAGGPAGGAGGNGSAVGGRRRKNKGRKTRSKSRQNRNRSRKSRRSRA